MIEQGQKGKEADLHSGEHLALFFTVQQAVVVLHRDERGQPVRDRVICSTPMSVSAGVSLPWSEFGDANVLCIA